MRDDEARRALADWDRALLRTEEALSPRWSVPLAAWGSAWLLAAPGLHLLAGGRDRWWWGASLTLVAFTAAGAVSGVHLARRTGAVLDGPATRRGALVGRAFAVVFAAGAALGAWLGWHGAPAADAVRWGAGLALALAGVLAGRVATSATTSRARSARWLAAGLTGAGIATMALGDTGVLLGGLALAAVLLAAALVERGWEGP